MNSYKIDNQNGATKLATTNQIRRKNSLINKLVHELAERFYVWLIWSFSEDCSQSATRHHEKIIRREQIFWPIYSGNEFSNIRVRRILCMTMQKMDMTHFDVLLNDCIAREYWQHFKQINKINLVKVSHCFLWSKLMGKGYENGLSYTQYSWLLAQRSESYSFYPL